MRSEVRKKGDSGSQRSEYAGKLVTWVQKDPPASTAELSDVSPYIVQSRALPLLLSRVGVGIDC
jgi:hypothetical protein